jgi:hypothetical protein
VKRRSNHRTDDGKTGSQLMKPGHSTQNPARAVFLPQADLHPAGGMPYFQCLRHGRPPPTSKNRIKPNYRRRVLRPPDLDHCKAAVLNSLGSPASRRVYEYAIDQFIAWYCSEPRLAFNRIVVVRHRMYLESHRLVLPLGVQKKCCSKERI